MMIMGAAVVFLFVAFIGTNHLQILDKHNSAD